MQRSGRQAGRCGGYETPVPWAEGLSGTRKTSATRRQRRFPREPMSRTIWLCISKTSEAVLSVVECRCWERSRYPGPTHHRDVDSSLCRKTRCCSTGTYLAATIAAIGRRALRRRSNTQLRLPGDALQAVRGPVRPRVRRVHPDLRSSRHADPVRAQPCGPLGLPDDFARQVRYGQPVSMRILVVDNYDSFVFNLGIKLPRPVGIREDGCVAITTGYPWSPPSPANSTVSCSVPVRGTRSVVCVVGWKTVTTLALTALPNFNR